VSIKREGERKGKVKGKREGELNKGRREEKGR